jgi:hypothetical protein
MLKHLLTASAIVALSAGAAVAQGETTVTEPKITREQHEDPSQRLPLAGKADPADLLQNTDGSRGATRTTENLNKDVPAITEDNSDDVSKRIPQQ